MFTKSSEFGADAVIKTHAVFQNSEPQTVDLALAVSANSNDYLYLSLENSAHQTNWGDGLKWNKMEYDDSDHPISKMDIKHLYITRVEKTTYVIVDLVKEGSNFLLRYLIDPSRKMSGTVWNAHNLPVNINAENVFSCFGRRSEERVDGMYTLGEINGKKELIYTPIYNPFNPNIPPNSVSLKVPSSALALAAAQAGENTTDLYVVCGSALYYYPYDKQKDKDQGTVVFENDLFQDTTALCTHTSQDVVILGVNQKGELYFAQCPKEKQLEKTAWTMTTPLSKDAGYQFTQAGMIWISENRSLWAIEVKDQQYSEETQSDDHLVYLNNQLSDLQFNINF